MTAQRLTHGTVHKIPNDIREIITTDQEVYDAWEDLTPLARNEWICWIISVKKPETRKKHIERARRELKAGKRRPCCWMGCVHRKDKPLSSSQKFISKRSE